MVRAASKEIQRVGQQWQNRGEGCSGAGRTTGQIDDKRVADGTADGAAERCERSVKQTVGTHALREAVDNALADLARRFRGYIAGCEAGSASGEEQIGGACAVAQGRGDLVEFVRKGEDVDAGDTCLLQQGNDGRAGEIGLLAQKTTVADGQDDGSGVFHKSREALSHRCSLRD
jgi:hypothetical protein